MRGFPTLRGSRLVDPAQDWAEDGPAVARLREAGAVIMAKTTTPEFGWKAIGDSPLTGITRNPWNRERTTGGSSAGAAAACAAGIAPLHVGSDGAGSIRIPSAFTGIFGLKATFGRVPAHPPSAMGLLSNVGPMTRSVRDAAAMLTVLARPDHRDPYALPPELTTIISAGIEDGRAQACARRLQPRIWAYAKVDPEIAAAVCRGGQALRGSGRHRRRGRARSSRSPRDALLTLWAAGAAHRAVGLPEAVGLAQMRPRPGRPSRPRASTSAPSTTSPPTWSAPTSASGWGRSTSATTCW